MRSGEVQVRAGRQEERPAAQAHHEREGTVMSCKVLVVTGSPRVGGNSDTLAEAFIEGAKSAGCEVRRIDAGARRSRAALGATTASLMKVHAFSKTTCSSSIPTFTGRTCSCTPRRSTASHTPRS